METFLNGRVEMHCGDARAVLATLPDDHFDCVVTSPPYWGLRDYGVDGQLGIEHSLGEHLDTMVAVFRDVRRVLKPTGTLWLNYGDCYATSPNGRSAADTKALGNDDRTFRDKPFSTIGPIYGVADNKGRFRAGGTLKPKDLCMVPNRLAIALQEDGWWVRSEIVWGKPNAMPSSVKDRPASAHEKVWLLSRWPKYFYDHVAVRQPSIKADPSANGGRNLRNYEPPPDDVGCGIYTAANRAELDLWHIPSRAFPEAHFATFPPALAERCIRAGTPERGCCAHCGAPWRRQTKTTYRNPGNRTTNGPRSLEQRDESPGFEVRLEAEVTTMGWDATCKCDCAETVPARVLDPFGGAGTVALVAARLGRHCTLIELKSEYCAMARRRIEHDWMGPEERARALVKERDAVAPFDDTELGRAA